MADFVYNFVKKPYTSKQLRWHIWPTFPKFESFYAMFTEGASLLLLYMHGAKKSKITKNSNQGDPAVNTKLASISYLAILVKYILAKKKKTLHWQIFTISKP